MKEQKVSVSFYLEKTKPNNEGKCLIKMVVYCNPSKKRYSTNEHITEAEWDKMNGSNLRDNNLKNINAKLGELRAKASKIIDTLSPFSFIAFKEAFYDNVEVNKNTTLQHWFDSYINKLKAKDCIGTAIAYRTTINSINLFKKNLHLQDITPNFLEEYEAFLSDTGKSNTSISIYMRQLRAIINQAIEANILPQAKYPFKKYEIPASSNVKKALSNDDVSKLEIPPTLTPSYQGALTP
jgi:hypothetical protein